MSLNREVFEQIINNKYNKLNINKIFNKIKFKINKFFLFKILKVV